MAQVRLARPPGLCGRREERDAALIESSFRAANSATRRAAVANRLGHPPGTLLPPFAALLRCVGLYQVRKCQDMNAANGRELQRSPPFPELFERLTAAHHRHDIETNSFSFWNVDTERTGMSFQKGLFAES